jgi:CheY-like chemotaxis protein
VVEDDPDTRSLMTVVLSAPLYACEATGDPEHALQRLAEWRPHVVLVDIGLPKLNGYELAGRIRTSAGPAIRLIATTGQADEERSKLAGFDAVLGKPIELAKLLSEISRLG